MKNDEDTGYDDAKVGQKRKCAENYFRLVQLTMIEGTNVVRKTFLSRIHRNKKTLHALLAERRSEFVRKGSGFNRQQLEILYPTGGGSADLSRIDMTLWFALARKLHVMPKGYAEGIRTESRTQLILGTPVEWCQDLTTIHTVRNNLFHLVRPEMDTETFDDQWSRVAEALVRLDPTLDPEVDFCKYRTMKLNAEVAREFQLMIREQCLQERCDQLIEEVHRRHRIVQIILFLMALVLLLVLVAVLVFFLVFRHPRSCDKTLQYRVVGIRSGAYFLPRNGWGAVAPSDTLETQKHPVPYIAYTHTADISQCTVTEECCNQVKNIQYLHMTRNKFSDIGFHYLIDNKGIIYEGRDVTKVPAAVRGWNRRITSVAFIGNFMYQRPTREAIGTFDVLIDFLLINRWIPFDYRIYAMCQLIPTLSPGINLYEDINSSTLGRIRHHVATRPGNHCWFNDTTLMLIHENQSKYRSRNQ